MGLRARLERDLRATNTALSYYPESRLLLAAMFKPRRRLERRAHLLEFVLSGRYAELAGKAHAERVMRESKLFPCFECGSRQHITPDHQ